MLFGLELRSAMVFWMWFGWLWPLFASLLFVLVRRASIAKSISYFVFASLISFGLHSVVQQFLLTLPYDVPADESLRVQFLHAYISALAWSGIASFALGLGVLYWFYRFTKPDASNISYMDSPHNPKNP